MFNYRSGVLIIWHVALVWSKGKMCAWREGDYCLFFDKKKPVNVEIPLTFQCSRHGFRSHRQLFSWIWTWRYLIWWLTCSHNPCTESQACFPNSHHVSGTRSLTGHRLIALRMQAYGMTETNSIAVSVVLTHLLIVSFPEACYLW